VSDRANGGVRSNGNRTALRWVARLPLYAGALMLLVILGLTVVDVFGRYILDAPVNGKTELTRLMMGTMIALALPVVSARDQHITVDLFDGLFGPHTARLRDAAINAVCGVSTLILAWWVMFRAERLMKWGYVSDFLHLPLYPVAYFIALMVAVTGCVLLVKAVLGPVAKPHARGGDPMPPRV
jgi:TRAP-type C4-dicarboxylate transport system permease small subunit